MGSILILRLRNLNTLSKLWEARAPGFLAPTLFYNNNYFQKIKMAWTALQSSTARRSWPLKLETLICRLSTRTSLVDQTLGSEQACRQCSRKILNSPVFTPLNSQFVVIKGLEKRATENRAPHSFHRTRRRVDPAERNRKQTIPPSS